MMPKRLTSFLAAVLFCYFSALTATSARANDTALSYGGTPQMMQGHPSVSMESERIEMTIGEKEVSVDCRFVFYNHGPTCRVRMGFPDSGNNADTEESAGSGFNTFLSWVNGRPVKTQLLKSKETGEFWHTKLVQFPAGKQTLVRDLYTVPVGFSVGYGANYGVHLASYTLHTGSSWYGLLGRSVVIVAFKRKIPSPPFSLIRLPDDFEAGAKRIMEDKEGAQRRIYYRGPCEAGANGTRLQFIRTHWRPTRNDDILIIFDKGKLPG